MKKIIEIVEQSDAAFLSTITDSGYPEVRALLNLANPKQYKALVGKALIQEGEQLTLYFTTNTSSRKVSQLQKNGKVALYFCVPKKFKGVCLMGDMEVVEDMALKESLWQTEWLMYYHKGKNDPDYAVLKFTSKSIHSWHNANKFDLGEVME